jgi:hypothetical protein
MAGLLGSASGGFSYIMGQRHPQPHSKLPASHLQLPSPSLSQALSCAAVPKLLRPLPQLDMHPPSSAAERGS